MDAQPDIKIDTSIGALEGGEKFLLIQGLLALLVMSPCKDTSLMFSHMQQIKTL